MNTILVYKSVSGFTERYARYIAREVNCRMLPWKEADASAVSGCDILIYGSRLHASRLDGLGKARKLYAQSGARRFVVFATGGMPNSAADTIEEMWRGNLTPEEMEAVPHFYMQAGICYERLGWLDRTVMKMAAGMMAKQAAKNPAAAESAQALQASYDIADRQYIEPLVACIRGMD